MRCGWRDPSRAASSASRARARHRLTASISAAAWSRSRISAEPDSLPVTSRAGQPMLMSMMSAPSALGDARALGHPARLAAGKLYDEGLAVAAPCLAPRLVALGDQMLAGDHLGDHETGPQSVRQTAKREVGDARHGRQQYGVGQRVRTDTDRRRWRRVGTNTCAIAHILGIFSECSTLGQTSLQPLAVRKRESGPSTVHPVVAPAARRLTGSQSVSPARRAL